MWPFGLLFFFAAIVLAEDCAETHGSLRGTAAPGESMTAYLQTAPQPFNIQSLGSWLGQELGQELGWTAEKAQAWFDKVRPALEQGLFAGVDAVTGEAAADWLRRNSGDLGLTPDQVSALVAHLRTERLAAPTA